MTSDPSRWSTAVLLAGALALGAGGLASLFGSLSAGPVLAIAGPALGLGIQILPRPMYVAVTDQRLICRRVSRLRGTPGQIAFAVSLADLRVLEYRPGKYQGWIRCECPGRKPMLLRRGRASREDFAEVQAVLARSGAFAKLDPPYPAADSLPAAT